MKRTVLLGLLALGVGVLGACGSNDDNASATTGTGGGGAAGGHGGGHAFTLNVQWSPCPLISEGAGMEAECAEVEVPLHWSRPDEERITLFLKRHAGTPGAGQSWFLTGGPGQPGSDMEQLVAHLKTLAPERSYYMLDHRGVGRSTRLRCLSSERIDSPNSIGLGEGEEEACLTDVLAQWSEDQLSGFSSVNAGHDVGRLIEHLRFDDEGVSIWGGSYGTHWLERYLAFYADQPSAVVFSAVALDVDLLMVDRYVDDMAQRWLDACDAEPSCGGPFQQTFGQSAKQVALATLSGSDKALCPDLAALGLTLPILKPFFGQLLGSVEARQLYAPFIYRAARCQPHDVAALTNLVQALSPPPGQEIPFGIRFWGFVLSENIAASELSTDISPAQAQQNIDNAIAVQGVGPRLARSREIWPRYKNPPFTNSDYTGAVLLLHGEYDFLPESVYERTVNHYLSIAPNAAFVLLPGAPHSLESTTGDNAQCGLSMAIQRILDATAPLPDCVESILPLSFAPPANLSAAVFGTDDPWEGAPAAMIQQAPDLRALQGAPAAPWLRSFGDVGQRPFGPRRALPRLRLK